MAYIGNQPTIGQYRKLDDISGSFNGSLTAFTMQVGSTNVNAGSVFQLLISLGGVIQNPGTDFTVSGSTLTFTTAPTSGLDFFGILMGQPLNTATPGDSTVTGAKIVDGTITGGKLAAGFNYDSGLLFLDDTNNRVGIGTASPNGKLVVGNGTAESIQFDPNDASNLGRILFFNRTTDTDNDGQIRAATIRFNIGTTEGARIDSSRRLLVGTTSSSNTAEGFSPAIQIASTGAASASSITRYSSTDSHTPRIALRKSASDTLGTNALVSNDEALGGITFEGSTDSGWLRGAQIEATTDGGTTGAGSMPTRLTFSTTAAGAGNPTERLRITSDGTLQLRNSPGIDFSQIQTNAAGMTSETLDSYEEGTWQCEIGGISGETYTAQQGRYVKIGTLCLASARVALGNKGSASSNITFTMPFAKKSTDDARCVGNFQWENMTTAVTNMYGLFYLTQNMTLYAEDGNSTSSSFVYHGDLANNTVFHFSVVYHTA